MESLINIRIIINIGANVKQIKIMGNKNTFERRSKRFEKIADSQ